MNTPQQAPTPHDLFCGAIMGSIAHAVGVAKFPEISNEQSWDGSNYNVQDSAGSRGTVAFERGAVVGGFYLDGSERSASRGGSVGSHNVFQGLPAGLSRLAFDEVSQYLLIDVDGAAQPWLTAAFWGESKDSPVSAAEDWRDVYDNGALLLRRQMLSPQDALAAWVREYDLTKGEADIVMQLYEVKCKDPSSPITLAVSDVARLTNAASQEGIDACQESFAEIQISFSER